MLAVDFALRMTFDTLDQATLYSDIQRSTIKLTPEQLAEELSRVFLSYLGVEIRRPHGNHPRKARRPYDALRT